MCAKRSAYLQVRLHEWESEALREAAQRSEETASRLARRAIRMESARILDPAGDELRRAYAQAYNGSTNGEGITWREWIGATMGQPEVKETILGWYRGECCCDWNVGVMGLLKKEGGEMNKEVKIKAAAAGLHVSTWSPGDGCTRYRFSTIDDGYFGDGTLFTALGSAEAKIYLAGFLQGLSQQTERMRVR